MGKLPKMQLEVRAFQLGGLSNERLSGWGPCTMALNLGAALTLQRTLCLCLFSYGAEQICVPTSDGWGNELREVSGQA